jgi:hypothetical protein
LLLRRGGMPNLRGVNKTTASTNMFEAERTIYLLPRETVRASTEDLKDVNLYERKDGRRRGISSVQRLRPERKASSIHRARASSSLLTHSGTTLVSYGLATALLIIIPPEEVQSRHDFSFTQLSTQTVISPCLVVDFIAPAPTFLPVDCFEDQNDRSSDSLRHPVHPSA